MAALSLCAAFFSAGLLIVIIGSLFIGALPVLSPHFVLSSEYATRVFDGAIGNAIVGTILISVLATIFAVPFAFGTAIYLAKYAPENKYTATIRFFIEVLSGTPSVVIGVVGFLLLVLYLKYFTGGYSLLAGSLGLAILIIPVIERAAEEAITSISAELEEGSYALGATKWQTLRHVTIPSAISGILAGVILGFGRSAEESAVVFLTAGYSQFMPEFGIKSNPNLFLGVKIYPLQDLVGTLPISVYNAYEHANVVPAANAFAAATVLIAVVLSINIGAKVVCSRAISNTESRPKGILWSPFGFIITRFHKKTLKKMPVDTDRKTIPRVLSGVFPLKEDTHPPAPSEERDQRSSQVADTTLPPPSSANPRKPSGLWKKSFLIDTDIARLFQMIRQRMRIPVVSMADPRIVHDKNPVNHGRSGGSIRTFIRILVPFTIPTVLLIVVAFLASIPPLHDALGPVSPPLAGLFASGFAGIGTVAGLIFALMFTKRGGAFRAKNRRTGYAAVAAGFCILCIAGIICSSSTAGFFKTGNPAATQNGSNRSAKLAAMLAAGELGGDEQGSAIAAQIITSPTTAPSAVPTQVRAAAATPNVPMKDALDVGESYRFGDADHACRATVYDYKVLPFYFWWWMDWNRFMQQLPANVTDSYLVVFLRIEDDGKQSAIVPSATQIVVSDGNTSYVNEPYFNTSVLSSTEYTSYSAEYIDQLPYQWIREIGQQKRDYAYLTGYSPFEQNTSSQINTSSLISNESMDTNGQGFFINPGSSNALDGYLVYEVPDTVASDLNNTYVQVSFSANSGTRWRLGRAHPA
jgi:phosphate transport system permease protein